jgi:hypothetical protein
MQDGGRGARRWRRGRGGGLGVVYTGRLEGDAARAAVGSDDGW